MGGGEDAGGGVWEDDGGAGFNGGVRQCQTDRSAAAPGQLQQWQPGRVYISNGSGAYRLVCGQPRVMQ
jgi:hypothetical protein